MTASTEPQEPPVAATDRMTSDPRPDVHLTQEEALPGGRVAVTCPAPYGIGGLGRHLQEIVDALQRRRQPHVCICGSPAGHGSRSGRDRVWTRAADAALGLPPLRLAAARRVLQASVSFDAGAARRLPAADHLIAFNGTALEQIAAVRRAGWKSVSLVSATTHLEHVLRQHALAYRRYPLEGSWAPRVAGRTLQEYAQADHIFVSSRYVRESFIEAGVREEALLSFPLTPGPRFTPGPPQASASTFDIVYVGGLTVVKGVPLLVDAVRALPHADLRLVLVGGWSSRGMRRFIQAAAARDPRISPSHGDPLHHLRSARLYVHPSYGDGFGYAPAEALACGVPVIVSEDTGMKELIDSEPSRGIVVPTGDLDALTEAIDGAYRGEILATVTPAPA